jgi:branched-chain amino acid transport system substrate-binding protein
MNTNQFPIQNIYLREAVMDADGVATTKVIGTVFKNHSDAYASECKF